MIRAEFPNEPKLKVEAFEGLLVEFARAQGADVLLRGIRSISDFESEFAMALTNNHLDPGIETVFLAPDESYAFLSSRLVKEVVKSGGAIDRFLTPAVATALQEKLDARS